MKREGEPVPAIGEYEDDDGDRAACNGAGGDVGVPGSLKSLLRVKRPTMLKHAKKRKKKRGARVTHKNLRRIITMRTIQHQFELPVLTHNSAQSCY